MRPSHTFSAALPVVIAVAGFTEGARAQQYDFSEVTALCQGALAGQNVNTPVPGFELLLLKDGRRVYQRAFGTWSVGQVGNADSCSKTVSGAVVMSLVDSGAWTLQSRIAEFLPEFGTGPKATITVAQCFSHTSGMFANTGAEGDASITLRQAAQQISAVPLRSLPGSAFNYGGVSMQVAGAAAEVAGGALWNVLFQQRIGVPLGLVATRYALTSPLNPRIAGGCESNAEEFGRFMEMLRRGGVYDGPSGPVRVLSAAAAQALITRQTPPNVTVINSPLQDPLGDPADYGVGVWLSHMGPQGELSGALAAGARGFGSWIDLDDAVVGTFATDLSASGNVQRLYTLLSDAAARAVRAPFCDADINTDGRVDPDDLSDFVGIFFTPGFDYRKDFNRDRAEDPDDLADYIAAFFTQEC